MLTILLMRLVLVVVFAGWASAFVYRDTGFNSTSSSSTSSSRRGKIHAESTATGFEDTSSPSIIEKETPTGPDIGSIIQTGVGAGPTPSSSGVTVYPTIHTESSASGWGVTDGQAQITSAPAAPKSKQAEATSYGQYTPLYVATSVVVGGQTLTPGGSTATLGSGSSATKVYLDSSGTAVVIVGDKTTTAPIPPSTTVIAGQTLVSGGAPITVGSAPDATTLSINPAGSTIAIAHGTTSTLVAPATQVLTIGEITATLLTNPTNGPAISTAVVDGTTQYIVGSQTLAPGHPITLNGTPISIATSAGSTVLVIGDMTTTIGGLSATDFAAGSTGLGTARPASGTGTGPSGAAATGSGKKGAAGMQRGSGSAALIPCGLALGWIMIGLG